MYVYQRQQYPVKMMLQAVICRFNFRQITIFLPPRIEFFEKGERNEKNSIRENFYPYRILKYIKNDS